MRFLFVLLLIIALVIGCSEGIEHITPTPVEKATDQDTTETNELKEHTSSDAIEFNHSIHAGVQGIDCSYCHKSEKNGQPIQTPSTDVCFECHKTTSGSVTNPPANKLPKGTIPASDGPDIQVNSDFFSTELHARHVELGTGCISCHSTNEGETLDAYVCAKCHY